MFKPTYLYIKTHNKTGLKYFGKTTSKDPYTYPGSGTYWSRHLKEHGVDISTEILGYYEDKEFCISEAINFSETNDIVNSTEWANLIPENGINGGYVSETHYSNLSISGNRAQKLKLKYDPEFKSRKSLASSLTMKKLHEEGKIIYGLGFKGRSHTAEYKLNRSKSAKITSLGERNSQFGTCWIHNTELNKKINKSELNTFIEEGWIKGRLMNLYK